MPRPVPHPEDRLLTSDEAASRIHCAEPDWWGIAKASPILRAGRRRRGKRTYWLASSVAAYCHDLPAVYVPPALRAVS